MITYDNFPQSELENICEAENNAAVMKRFIDETSLTTDINKRKKAILHLWSDYMNSFWDEGNDLNEKDHWKQQWEWGSEILDYMDEYISNQNTKKKIKLPSDGAIPDELFTNPDAVFENLLDGSENFALIKGNIKKNKNPRVRVISSNIVKNYLMGERLPNSFNQTIDHFQKYKDCVLIFVRDSNLKSVSETLRRYKSKNYYKSGQDKLIKNYGIGAQIIKALNIKNMILVTRSRKKVIGLEGYGIKISKQEIIK